MATIRDTVRRHCQTCPWLLLFAIGLSSTQGAFQVLHQTGRLSVRGQDGDLSVAAPPNAPWFTTIRSGGGSQDWFAQSLIASSWIPRQMSIYAESIVSAGTGTPLLTQSLSEVSLEFRVDQPTGILFQFSAFPDQSGPTMPLNETSMRVVSLADGSELLNESTRERYLILPPGAYRMESINDMGNLPTNPVLPEGARMLSLLANEGLPGDANLNGVVDGGDFNIWNANKFTSGTGWFTGDFNGDQFTDGADFNIWNAHKFQSLGDAGIVPEPTVSWLLGSLSAFSLVLRRKRPRIEPSFHPAPE